MAKSTCNPNVNIPKGMMKFEVIRSTIRDSLGQYCVPGDMAVLDKNTAQGYLDKNYIRVALPDFDVDDEPTEEADHSSEEVGEDEAERSEASSDTGPSRRQRRTRAAANG
jgi:hypothetical protein